MTRLMYWSSFRSEGITSRVVRSWMEAFGTLVVLIACWTMVEMALNDSVDSLPPVADSERFWKCLNIV